MKIKDQSKKVGSYSDKRQKVVAVNTYQFYRTRN